MTASRQAPRNRKSTVQVARYSAGRGMFVFPLPPLMKSPPLFNDYAHKATRNPTRIEAWHRANFGANWGIAPGLSGLLVVDEDNKPGKDGAASLDLLELMHGKLPETFTVRTPSGGRHLYFHGPHVFNLGFRPGLDSPQYTLAPGCTLENGNRYIIINNGPIADAPAWLIAVISEGAERAEHVAQEYLVEPDQAHEIAWYREWLRNDAPPSIMDRGGGDVLVKIIAPMGKDHGLTPETVKEILSETGGYNETKCQPSWDLSDDNANGLFKKVDNGFAYCRENAPGAKTAQADFANDPVSDDEIATIAAWWKVRDAAEANGEQPSRAERRLMRKKKEAKP
jgi:hypothetical protein